MLTLTHLPLHYTITDQMDIKHSSALLSSLPCKNFFFSSFIFPSVLFEHGMKTQADRWTGLFFIHAFFLALSV